MSSYKLHGSSLKHTLSGASACVDEMRRLRADGVLGNPVILFSNFILEPPC